MAIGAKPAGALPWVEPMMTNRNIAVITTSHTSTDTIEYLPGDRSNHLSRHVRHQVLGRKAAAGLRPKLTAGVRWQPEMWPMA